MSTGRAPICIAGMHRTGSSMTTRVINLLGVEIGNPEELQPATSSNVEGHWEHMEFMLANDAMLSAVGHAWDLPPDEDVDWSAALGGDHVALGMAQRAIDGLAPRGWWGWKDPRNSLTLDVWRDRVPGMRLVVCLRHPVAVAMSLHSRQMMSFEAGIDLWVRYYEHLERRLDQYDVHVAEYEEMLATPQMEVTALADWLGVTSAGAIVAACSSIKPKHNHEHPDEQLIARMPRRAVELYSRFQALAAQHRGGEAGRDQKLAELQVALGAARHQIDTVVPQLEHDLVVARAAITDLEQQMELAVGQRDAAIHEREALRSAHEQAVARIAELEGAERARDDARAALAGVLDSASWKMTRPLRRLRRSGHPS